MQKYNIDHDRPCIYFVIGLMPKYQNQLDVVYCTFQKKYISPNKWDHAVIFAETYAYPQNVLIFIFFVMFKFDLFNIFLRLQIKLNRQNSYQPINFVNWIEIQGNGWGIKYNNLFKSTKFNRQQIKLILFFFAIKIDLVSSCGHTVFHSTQQGLSVQIGHLASIAAIVQKTVIGDFRQLDVSLGGSGKQLTSIGDRLLFEDYSFCLNLNEMANITYTNPSDSNILIAQDICVCNELLNYFIGEHQISYNENILSSVDIIEELLNTLVQLDVNNQYSASEMIQIISSEQFNQFSIQQKIRTCIEMITIKISLKLKSAQNEISKNEQLYQSIYMPKFNFPTIIDDLQAISIQDQIRMKLLVSGDGHYFKYLLLNIKNECNNLGIDLYELEYMAQYKEAMIYAFLGVLRYRQELNILDTVTGAKHSTSSGGIYYNFQAKSK